MPPPAVASTRISATSCCIFSCICCAWRIMFCMLPGSFMDLLLEVANFAYFAAEDFPEALDLGIGERAAGDFVLRVGFRRREVGRGRSAGCGLAGGELHAQRAAEDFADRLFEGAVAEVQAVGFRRGDVELG